MRIALLLLFVASGCSALPDRFTRGHRDIHPRFGVAITNETPEHFDLEVIVMDYGGFQTEGEPHVERAKDVFLEVVRRYAKNHNLTIIEVPRVELYLSQVHNNWDGTSSTRVSKRIYIERKTD